jgi:hypothetical protein
MKKIILLFALFAIFLNGQSQPKPLKGFYVKITLIGTDSIRTWDNILKAKTYPTAWYFAEVNSSNTLIDISRINWDQMAKFTFSFNLYADYYQYWNYYGYFNLPIKSFESAWVDIADGDGFSFENDIPFMIATGFSQVFGLPINRFQVLDFY